jgi:3-oxoadipate enol-lactonase
MFLERPTHRLHYRVDGSHGPWLVFCNSLGTDLSMWDPQLDPLHGLARELRVLRYDRRGHGQSTPSPPPPYTIADLAGDVLALLDELSITRAHFCGLSIGGLVGQWLGAHAPTRIDRLIVCATAPRIGTSASWQQRIAQVTAGGLSPLVPGMADRWFRPEFIEAHPALVKSILAQFAQVSPRAYVGCCEALAACDLRADLPLITAPLLAISGDDDAVCRCEELRLIADTVGDGRHVSFPGRHLINVEAATTFTAHVREFLAPTASRPRAA